MNSKRVVQCYGTGEGRNRLEGGEGREIRGEGRGNGDLTRTYVATE